MLVNCKRTVVLCKRKRLQAIIRTSGKPANFNCSDVPYQVKDKVNIAVGEHIRLKSVVSKVRPHTEPSWYVVRPYNINTIYPFLRRRLVEGFRGEKTDTA